MSGNGIVGIIGRERDPNERRAGRTAKQRRFVKIGKNGKIRRRELEGGRISRPAKTRRLFLDAFGAKMSNEAASASSGRSTSIRELYLSSTRRWIILKLCRIFGFFCRFGASQRGRTRRGGSVRTRRRTTLRLKRRTKVAKRRSAARARLRRMSGKIARKTDRTSRW